MAKPAQLVSQHLENISREALEKYQKIIRNYVRAPQRVYALYRRGRPQAGELPEKDSQA